MNKPIEELQFLSDKISTQVRTISVSLIAFIWILLLGGEKAPFVFLTCDKRQLIVIIFLAVFTMFCDYLQYFFGYIDTNSVHKDMELNKKAEGEWDSTSFSYRMRKGMFWMKQILLFLIVIWLGVIIAKQFLSTAQ